MSMFKIHTCIELGQSQSYSSTDSVVSNVFRRC